MEKVDTLVIGSGAAGLAAANRLRASGGNPLLCTEGLDCGTSVNTGSDKQTYYKLALDGAAPDSPVEMAREMASGGAMHGDIALVEASLSAVCFSHLVSLGVAFPHDEYGRHVGYRTDHDLRSRATSAGPYTSRDMCRALLREARLLGVRIAENLVAVKLLVADGRACGAVFAHTDCATPAFTTVLARDVVFAVGGPGGLYGRSVYPGCHTGAIGLALLEGAEARNLAEAQFGMASVKFRWNVSGSYMQVVPRIFSVDGNGVERNFVSDFFGNDADAWNALFLKGYQWPFSANHAQGSSLIDILVFMETVRKGRRVFLDYRHANAPAFLDMLSPEAREYLEKSGATGATPYERLAAMNPRAIALYREHGIDLAREPLEIAVCAQHNNGGLAGDIWWESTNIPHLFPVGEVNGSHGVTRPGGSALNAGQVGAWRAAEAITRRRGSDGFDGAEATCEAAAREAEAKLLADIAHPPTADWRAMRQRIQERMDEACGFARDAILLAAAATAAHEDFKAIRDSGLAGYGARECAEALRTRQLAAASYVYLRAAEMQVRRAGSRGGFVALSPQGGEISPKLGPEWRIAPEVPSARYECTVTRLRPDGEVEFKFEKCRPVPADVGWFERVWAEFLKTQGVGNAMPGQTEAL